MIIWITLLSTALVSVFALMLNSFSHWGNYASEQTRLDALALSVCHYRRDFLEEEIQKINRQIVRTQKVMDWSARACLAAPPGFKIKTCTISKRIIAQGQRLGALLVKTQDIERRTFPARAKARLIELKTNNSLTPSAGELRNRGGFSFYDLSLNRDGLKRARLSLERRTYERLFFAKWPQPLEPSPDFRQRHRYSFEFRPVRKLSGLDKDRSFTLVKKQTGTNGEAAVRSRCRIDTNPFRVERSP